MTESELLKLARLRELCASGRARAIRQAARVSEGEVARTLGINVGVISRWERSEKRPSRGQALAYYDLLMGLLAGQQ